MQPTTTSESSQNGYSAFVSAKSDTSYGARAFPHQNHVAALPGRATHHSDSTGDYRGIIDDLSVEIKTLKDELRRYKPTLTRKLRKNMLFEIRVHNLPRGQKRELEAMLGDIAANFDDLPDSATHRRKVSFKHETKCHYVRSPPSHATYPVSYSRPPDSTYSSTPPLGTDAPGRSGTSLGRPTMNHDLEYPDQLGEHYLRGIPAWLYARNPVMTDKEKGELVVRRLENVFTGQAGGNIGGSLPRRPGESPRPRNATYGAFGPHVDEGKPGRLALAYQSTFTKAAEPSRERAGLNFCEQSRLWQENSRSTVGGPEAGPYNIPALLVGNCGPDDRRAPSNNSSAKDALHALEERPTRATDLDPDRLQNPSENLGHIRLFGFVSLQPFGGKGPSATDVDAEAKSWVYLNLLCNMAQLHLISVTATFVRAAVASISTNLQISPDGSKVRWLGGSGGTKVSGDGSRIYAHSGQDTAGSAQFKVSGSRRPFETLILSGDNALSDTSSKNKPTPGRCLPDVGAVSRFHYTPVLFRRESSDSLTSFDGSSSRDAVENGNAHGGYGTSYHRKRSHDGAIIYYTGVPFCVDYSGDPKTLLPEFHTASIGEDMQQPPSEFQRPTHGQPASEGLSSQWSLTSEKLQNPYSASNVCDRANFPA
ncbi:hypothetical protein Purlil1_13236 [Purpureocillium lilacinum]|uniref:Frequency clock protein n=1 Tax=Purpureocillium lilacinum TaxID=33203 RepID=A0ABR0BEP2_PURLI|nr:hypothetical protein Purlil1_13236 [Purpureocillium lilacinum]